MSLKNRLSRRQFLGAAATSSLATFVAACAQPTATPTAKPAEPTKVAATSVPPTTAATKAPEATKAPVATAVPSKPVLPIVTQPLTFTYWVEQVVYNAAVMKSYGDIACYKELEKRTGIHIDFQHPAAGQAADQFNLMLASGKYPDMIEYNWYGVAGGPSKAIADKIILKLSDLIDQYAPALKTVYAQHPDWRKQVMTDAGEMYVFPFLRGATTLLTYGGPIVRTDWLEKLGFKVPTTVDDWHTVLKAFKEKDPNGNGKADEIPFSPNYGGSKMAAYNDHMFVGAWGITLGFFQEKGVVKYGPEQPQFKEFLTLISGWHKEGLIDPDFLSDDSKIMDAKMLDERLGSVYGYGGKGLTRWLTAAQPQKPHFKLAGAPYPALKAGEKPQLGQKDWEYAGGGSTAITTACKHAKEAAQWLDYKYSPEGSLLANWGVEGESYTMKDGLPWFTDKALADPRQESQAKYCLSGWAGPFIQDGRVQLQTLVDVSRVANATWADCTNEKKMPLVTPTAEEGKKIVALSADINTLFSERIAQFLTGAEPVANWDGVVAQLKSMGIDDILRLQQAALDRYNKR